MKKYTKEKYSLSVGESDLKRMTMLGEIYMPYCIDFLFENGLKPGLTVADVGCGPGNVSLWLAEQVGKTGKIIGIDNSDEQLTILNKIISEKQIDHVSTYQCDIYEVDQLDEKFDIIFCRFLFIRSSPKFAVNSPLFGLLSWLFNLPLCLFRLRLF
jgi:ubiquinone/menaquinone biosynthesis C-methylase UbiE